MSVAEFSFIVGMAFIAGGIAWIYTPAGVIAAGLAFCLLGYGLARDEMLKPKKPASKDRTE